jgi:Sensors of blue-light using FAD
MPQLSSLVYISLAPASANSETASAIAAAARQRNLALGVSGALLHYAGYYLQVLEGEQASVQALYERIRRDTRHFNARRVTLEPVPQRQFAGWAMHHVPAPSGQNRAVTVFLRSLWRGIDAAEAHTALTLLQQLIADASASSPSAVPAHH